jgi:3'-5' exoribonuclease
VPSIPRVADLEPGASGTRYYLCARKDVRQSRDGQPVVTLVLQDASGEVIAKVLPPDSARYVDEFEAGEFVLASGRAVVYQGRLELSIDSIRRVHPEQERARGFREDDCVPAAPRPVDDMWRELVDRIAAMTDGPLRVLVQRLLQDHEARYRVWPAAVTVHHAYRGGLLEHVLQVARIVQALAPLYDADADLLLAGAVLHDIGKLRELEYDTIASYSREGNLVGHVAIGLVMVREAARGVSGLGEERLNEVEHLITSHHGAREHGAPVEPMSVEAFILSTADDLDARLFQVRRHIAADEGDGPFTSYHTRLRRAFLKPREPR